MGYIQTRNMADIYSKEKRSYLMSLIRSQNTKPEIMVRKYLFNKGFRFRVNVKKLPGTPDIVLPKYRTVIFIHGCFWHGHGNCKLAKQPRHNKEYWIPKLENNKMRDQENRVQLETLGWKVLVIWECEIKKNKIQEIMEKIKEVLYASHSYERRPLHIKIYEPDRDIVKLVKEEIVHYKI